MSEFHRGDLVTFLGACAVLALYAGPVGVIKLIFNELLWFIVGMLAWNASLVAEGVRTEKRVKDNMRLVMHVTNTVGAMWWGCVLGGFTLALMAHCIERWWLRTLVNAALAAGIFAAGTAKLRAKKEWAQMEDDPPLWILAVCTIS